MLGINASKSNTSCSTSNRYRDSDIVNVAWVPLKQSRVSLCCSIMKGVLTSTLHSVWSVLTRLFGEHLKYKILRWKKPSYWWQQYVDDLLIILDFDARLLFSKMGGQFFQSVKDTCHQHKLLPSSKSMSYGQCGNRVSAVSQTSRVWRMFPIKTEKLGTWIIQNIQKFQFSLTKIFNSRENCWFQWFRGNKCHQHTSIMR